MNFSVVRVILSSYLSDLFYSELNKKVHPRIMNPKEIEQLGSQCSGCSSSIFPKNWTETFWLNLLDAYLASSQAPAKKPVNIISSASTSSLMPHTKDWMSHEIIQEFIKNYPVFEVSIFTELFEPLVFNNRFLHELFRRSRKSSIHRILLQSTHLISPMLKISPPAQFQELNIKILELS